MAKPFFEAVAEILAATNLALGDSVRASRDIQDAHYRAVQEAVAAERTSRPHGRRETATPIRV